MLGPKAANFDRVARLYAALERLTFGHALSRCRSSFLGDARLVGTRRALLLGDGDGRFSAALLGRFPALEVTAVDASAAMLAELESRVRRRSPAAALELEQADLRAWVPRRPGYDLVVTHFVFDCFTTTELGAIVLRVAPAVTRNGRWLVSDFAIPARGVAGLLAACLVRALYFAFWVLTGLDVTTLPEHASALKAAGFACAAVETRLGGALRSELWERS